MLWQICSSPRLIFEVTFLELLGDMTAWLYPQTILSARESTNGALNTIIESNRLFEGPKPNCAPQDNIEQKVE